MKHINTNTVWAKIQAFWTQPLGLPVSLIALSKPTILTESKTTMPSVFIKSFIYAMKIGYWQEGTHTTIRFISAGTRSQLYHLQKQTPFFYSLILRMRNSDSSIVIATGSTADESGFNSRQEFSTASRPTLGPTHPPVEWVEESFARDNATGACS